MERPSSVGVPQPDAHVHMEARAASSASKHLPAVRMLLTRNFSPSWIHSEVEDIRRRAQTPGFDTGSMYVDTSCLPHPETHIGLSEFNRQRPALPVDRPQTGVTSPLYAGQDVSHIRDAVSRAQTSPVWFSMLCFSALTLLWLQRFSGEAAAPSSSCGPFAISCIRNLTFPFSCGAGPQPNTY